LISTDPYFCYNPDPYSSFELLRYINFKLSQGLFVGLEVGYEGIEPDLFIMGTLLVGVPPWSSGVRLPREAAGAPSPVQQGPQDWQHITHEHTLRASVYQQVQAF
jgi:hypothetical protein